MHTVKKSMIILNKLQLKYHILERSRDICFSSLVKCIITDYVKCITIQLSILSIIPPWKAQIQCLLALQKGRPMLTSTKYTFIYECCNYFNLFSSYLRSVLFLRAF